MLSNNPDQPTAAPTSEQKLTPEELEQKALLLLKQLTLAFDIDDTLATSLKVSLRDQDGIKKLEDFKTYAINAKPPIDIIDLVFGTKATNGNRFFHVIHPGVIEMMQWLHHFGAEIAFFSAGTVNRNYEFIKQLFSLAKISEKELKDPTTILSVDDRHMCTYSEMLIQSQRFDIPFKTDDFKKKLLDHFKKNFNRTVLVDNDYNNIYPGEEKHALITHLEPGKINLDDYDFNSEKASSDPDTIKKLLSMNNIFYIVGIIKTALEMTAKGGDFLDNLFSLQFFEKNPKMKPEFFNPIKFASKKRFETNYEYYKIGLEELKKINPHLTMFGQSTLDKVFPAEKEREFTYI